MRWPIVLLMLPLLGCGGNDNRGGGIAGQNLTLDSGQCAKHAWGSPEMAQCLDAIRAARSVQPVAPTVASVAPGPAVQPVEAAPATSSWRPWTWFSSGASE